LPTSIAKSRKLTRRGRMAGAINLATQQRSTRDGLSVHGRRPRQHWSDCRRNARR
jgi:hypothetical protein